MNHYTRQLTVTLASIAVASKLIYNEVKPIALELYAFYTSEKAKRVYEFVILSIIAIAWMSAYAAVKGGNLARQRYDRFLVWRDAFVESHLQPVTVAAITPKASAHVVNSTPKSHANVNRKPKSAPRDQAAVQSAARGFATA